MAKDKTNPFAAGKIDLSNDYLSLKAAGVENDPVEVLPTRFRIGLGRALVLTSAAAVKGGTLTVKGGIGLFELAKLLMKPRQNGAAKDLAHFDKRDRIRT